MTTLQDYLGSLVRDLNHARVIADVETANIAKMYVEHDLLKHFSIPRMKIQDTELTIPIAIDELDTVVEKDYQPIDNKRFYTKTYNEIKNVFQVSSFNREVSGPLRKEIYQKIDSLEKALKGGESIQVSLESFTEEVSNVTIDIIAQNKKEREVFEKALEYNKANNGVQIKESLRTALIAYLKPEIKPREVTGRIEDAQITVESDKLKEKRPESLVYIKMKITEESMEWQTMEDADGNIVAKLMAE